MLAGTRGGRGTPKKEARLNAAQPGRTPGNLWIYIALFVCTFAVYGQVRDFDFINYDDPEYISGNPQVREGLTADSVRWAFTSTEAANWFPLTRLSHILDVQLFRLDSGMHHLLNVLIHAAAATLLYAFLERATRARWPSAFVAFVFALHPLHVESVAWVAERKDVLSAFFWFLGLYSYVRYAERPAASRYLAVLGAFGLGLLSKPMIITFPFVLVLLDFWPLRRLNAGRKPLQWKVLHKKIPFFALSIIAGFVTYLVQAQSRAVKTFSVFPLGLRLENALISYTWYIAKTFWPSGLAVFYPYPLAINSWSAVLAGFLLLAVSLAVITTWSKRPYAAVGWFWFLGTLVPVIGLVQVGAQARADRYMYVPVVGLLIILAWSGAELVGRRPQTRGAAAMVAIAACVTCAALAVVQVSYWRNSESLFAHAIRVTTGNYVAEHNLGLAIAEGGRLPEAVAHYRAALAIRPDSVEAHSDLGTAFSNLGELQEASAEYRAALELAPDSAIPHNNLGNTYFRLGKLDAAMAEYKAAIRLQPDYAEAHNDLGAALASGGKMQDAADQFRIALRLNRDYTQARTNLDLALKEGAR